MVRPTNARPVVKGQVTYYEFSGLHDDTKPTYGVANGSLFLEMDTGDVYAYDEAGETWLKIAALGGDS